MKMLLALTIVSFSSSSLYSQSQIRSGVYSASGIISFASSSSEFQGSILGSTALVFSPSFSLFVSDQIELSTAPYLSSTSSEATFPGQPSRTSSANVVGIQLGFRYYFTSHTVAPFVGFGGGLSWVKQTGTFSPPTKTYNIGVGLDYFLAQSFAIEPGIQYRGTKADSMSDNVFFVSVGVKYFIL